MKSEKKQFNNLKRDVTILLFIVGEHSLHYNLNTSIVYTTQSVYILSKVGTKVFFAVKAFGNY